MKTFLVVKLEYTRGMDDLPTLELVRAVSLDDCLVELLGWGTEEVIQARAEYPSVTEAIREQNGEGMDWYMIKELLPDGTLSKDLLAWEDKSE